MTTRADRRHAFVPRRVEGAKSHNLAIVLVKEQMSTPVGEPTEITAKVQRLMVKLNFDLRGIQSKVDYLRETPFCSGWMVFLNKAHDLAHIMHQDDHDSYVRMRVPQRLKGASEEYIRRYFYNRMVGRYVI